MIELDAWIVTLQIVQICGSGAPCFRGRMQDYAVAP